MEKDWGVITAQEAERCAAKGASFLDEARPGWADKVDLDRLDLGDCMSCVLGQLYGGYVAGINSDELRLLFGHGTIGSHQLRMDHGFTLDCRCRYRDRGVSWAILTDAWKDLILARRKAVPA